MKTKNALLIFCCIIKLSFAMENSDALDDQATSNPLRDIVAKTILSMWLVIQKEPIYKYDELMLLPDTDLHELAHQEFKSFNRIILQWKQHYSDCQQLAINLNNQLLDCNNQIEDLQKQILLLNNLQKKS
jgi:hypothetical protein